MSLALLALLAAPPFAHSVFPVTREQLPHSWHPGCPVGPSSLRKLRVGYWGFDGKSQVGTLIVNRSTVDDLTVVFRRLYRARFPIRRMRPIDAYGGNDERSLAADNTIRSRTRTWRAGESIRARAERISTARTSGRAWPCGADCSSARSHRSAGSGEAAGPARRTTSTSLRRAVERLSQLRDAQLVAGRVTEADVFPVGLLGRLTLELDAAALQLFVGRLNVV